MTAAEWAVLVPAVAALATAVAAWIRAQAAHTKISATNATVTRFLTPTGKQPLQGTVTTLSPPDQPTDQPS